jgi:hypothetical protein
LTSRPFRLTARAGDENRDRTAASREEQVLHKVRSQAAARIPLTLSPVSLSYHGSPRLARFARRRSARGYPTPHGAKVCIGETGFEPATARPPAECATRLRHSPWVFHSAGSAGAVSLGTSCLLCILPVMGRCSRCKTEKSDEEFAWRRRARGQRDTYCRPCRAAYKQEHYRANKQRYIAAAGQRKKALVEERTLYLVAFLREHPCVDCGEGDPNRSRVRPSERQKVLDLGGNPGPALAGRARRDCKVRRGLCKLS